MKIWTDRDKLSSMVLTKFILFPDVHLVAAQLLVLLFKVVMLLELACGVSQMYKEENVTCASPARQICRPAILLDVVDVS